MSIFVTYSAENCGINLFMKYTSQQQNNNFNSSIKIVVMSIYSSTGEFIQNTSTLMFAIFNSWRWASGVNYFLVVFFCSCYALSAWHFPLKSFIETNLLHPCTVASAFQFTATTVVFCLIVENQNLYWRGWHHLDESANYFAHSTDIDFVFSNEEMRLRTMLYRATALCPSSCDTHYVFITPSFERKPGK